MYDILSTRVDCGDLGSATFTIGVNVASVPPGSIMLEVVADVTLVSPGALCIDTHSNNLLIFGSFWNSL
jgi:hypothetical protein